MRARKTQEQFNKEVYDLIGDEYSVLGEYINYNTKIKMKHNVCGCNWDPLPANFLHDHRCPKCANNLPYTTETFKEKVYELVGNEYEVLGEYKRALTKIKMRHTECETSYEVTPSGFLHDHRCPKCKGGVPYTDETFRQKAYELVGDEYSVLEEYKNSQTKILLQHNICGISYSVLPAAFSFGGRCPYCFGHLPYTTETFKEKVYELVGNEYEVLGEYKNYDTKIKIKHNKCGNDYCVVPDNFIHGTRCPVCNESKGEQKIRHYCEDNNEIFTPQYNKLPGLISDKGNPLKPDFVLFYDKEKTKVKGVIEYDGIGHFDENVFGKESYERTIYHDQLKNEYCKKNNIPLLRIPYWEFDNIEKILDNWLNKLNSN